METGKSILEAAQELGVALESICGGKHICGKCRVRIEEGFYARDGLNSSRGHLSLFQTKKRNSSALRNRNPDTGWPAWPN